MGMGRRHQLGLLFQLFNELLILCREFSVFGLERLGDVGADVLCHLRAQFAEGLVHQALEDRDHILVGAGALGCRALA